jgi:hypothetical protein
MKITLKMDVMEIRCRNVNWLIGVIVSSVRCLK